LLKEGKVGCLVFNIIKNLCAKCRHYFDNSESLCISNFSKQDRLSLIFSSTLLQIKITRRVKVFCRKNENRFWILYYRISQTKISFKCKECHKSAFCQEYIIDRLLKHIKRFDIEQESDVFKVVRANLTNSQTSIRLDTNAKEVATHYTKKITDEYREGEIDFDTGIALIESAVAEMEDEIKTSIEDRIQRYRLYQSPIILKDLICESLPNDTVVKEPILIELLHKEKFVNYIRQVIESRFIDFVKSKQYRDEILSEDEPIEPSSTDSSTKERDVLLEPLSNEDKILYKLKYAIPLDDREFLSVTYRLCSDHKFLSDEFSPDEKFYIKLSIQYQLDDDSPHFNMIDVPQTKASISQKILDYRENLKSNSYIEDKEEIFIKLIYAEPLSAKEMGVVLGFTSKQISKKVESMKKRLNRVEVKL